MLGSIVKPLAKLAIILIAVIFGAAICTLLVHFPLRFNPWMPKAMYWGAIWLTGILFGLGMVDLVVRRSSKGLKILGPVAAAVPAATVVLSYAILPLLNPAPESFVAPVVILLITLGAVNHYRSNRMGQRLRSGRLAALSKAGLFGVSLKTQALRPQAESPTVDVMGSYEITQCPDEYVGESIVADRRTIYEPFRNIVRGAIGSGIPIGLRLERSGCQNRIFFYTYSSTEQLLSRQMDILQGLLAANLSKFELSRRTGFARPFPTGIAAGAVASISGETVAVDDERQLPDPWTVVSKQFHYMDNAIIQVFANPVPSSPLSHLKRAYKGREYKTALGESQTTVTGKNNALFAGHMEQSVTQVNLESADKAGRLYRELHRLKAEHVCRVYANVLSVAATSGEATQNVRALTDLLKGALVPPDSGRDFKVDTLAWGLR